MWLLVPRFLPNRDSMSDLLGTRKRMKFFTEVVVPEGSPLIGAEGHGRRDLQARGDAGDRRAPRRRERCAGSSPRSRSPRATASCSAPRCRSCSGSRIRTRSTLRRPGRLQDDDHGRGADHARLPARRPLARQPAPPPPLRRLSPRRPPPEPEHRPQARRGRGPRRRHAAARGRARGHPPSRRRRRPRRPQRDDRAPVQARARAASCSACSRRSSSARLSRSRRSRSSRCSASSALLVTRTIEPEEAYSNVSASLLVLILAMLVVGEALDHSGAAQMIVDGDLADRSRPCRRSACSSCSTSSPRS